MPEILGSPGKNFVSLKWKRMCIALTMLIPMPMVMKGNFGNNKKTQTQPEMCFFLLFFFLVGCEKTCCFLRAMFLLLVPFFMQSCHHHAMTIFRTSSYVDRDTQGGYGGG